MSKLRFVEVVWDDHAFYQGETSAEDATLVVQRSVGLVVEETDALLKLAQTQTYKPESTVWCEVLVVDKRTLREIRELARRPLPEGT